MAKVDIERVTVDRINKKGRYEVQFDWVCPCGAITSGEYAESAHLISVVDVQCKKCGRPGFAVLPVLEERG